MFWSKTPPPSEPAPTVPAPAAPSSPNPTPKPPPATQGTPPLPQSREAAADAELAALLAELTSSPPPSTQPPPPPTPDKTSLPDASQLNCVTAFDELFYCYSLGSQFLNVYRYGGLRDCSEKSAAWRFCLKTRVRGEDAARKMVRERNMELAARCKEKGRSSEDVWGVRKAPVEGAFEGDFEELRDVLERQGGEE